MGLAALLSKQAVKLGITKEAPKALDKGLPLGGRIGGLVTIPSYPFVVAGAAGSLAVAPPTEGNRIQYVSSFTVGNHKTYRYYINAVRAFVQVTMEDDKIADVTYFSEVHRDYPESAEQIGELVDGMSYPEFNCPMTEPPTVYNRCAGTPDQDEVEPFHLTMRTIYDAMGQTGRQDNVTLGYYSRQLDTPSEPAEGPAGTPEFFLIELVEPIEDSLDANAGVSIAYYVGIPLNPISVQFI